MTPEICASSPNGRHQVDTSMEAGPNHCFNCEQPMPDRYRGWEIHQGRWPEPEWSATGPNYDASYEGEEDGWVDNGERADAPTRALLFAEIDAWFEENGQ